MVPETDACHRIRARIIEMASKLSSGAHIGPALSCVELLYASLTSPRISTVVLSKGHASLALYAAHAEIGLITEETLEEYGAPRNPLLGHPVRNVQTGVKFTTGSLGMGLSVALGNQLYLDRAERGLFTVCILGDGECQEGQVWEAASVGVKHAANLICIIDANGFQQTGSTTDISGGPSLHQRWKGFGWNTIEIDGHSVPEIKAALRDYSGKGPTCIVAKTVKGKGFALFENDNAWHHAQITQKQLEDLRRG